MSKITLNSTYYAPVETCSPGLSEYRNLINVGGQVKKFMRFEYQVLIADLIESGSICAIAAHTQALRF